MALATQPAVFSSTSSIYSATVLSDPKEIRSLAEGAKGLFAGRNSTSELNFFLATVSEKAWIPRVIVVKRSGAVAGLVYAKERRVAGVRTGLLYTDSTLGNMIVAEPAERGHVLLEGLKALLKIPGIRGARMLVPPDGFEMSMLRTMLSSLPVDITSVAAENHRVLPLPPDYNSFLESLGARTRRNFRYYRRRFEAADNEYVERVPFRDFEAAAIKLLEENVVGADAEGVRRALKMFSEAREPLLVGLRDQSGKWLSILGGWYDSGRVVIFFQMNSDKDNSRSSLCLVLRGYLFETLVAQGVRDVVFWAGVGEPLSRYSRPVPTVCVYLDKRQFLWRAFCKAVTACSGVLPPRLAPYADWVCAPTVRNGNHHSFTPDL